MLFYVILQYTHENTSSTLNGHKCAQCDKVAAVVGRLLSTLSTSAIDVLWRSFATFRGWDKFPDLEIPEFRQMQILNRIAITFTFMTGR